MKVPNTDEEFAALGEKEVAARLSGGTWRSNQHARRRAAAWLAKVGHDNTQVDRDTQQNILGVAKNTFWVAFGSLVAALVSVVVAVVALIRSAPQ